MSLFCRLLLSILLLPAVAASAATSDHPFDHSHSAWTELLKRHVSWNATGTASSVDYAGFARDRVALNAYLKNVAAVPIADYDRWSWPQRQASLINVYNAATVELVLTKFPGLDSIKDVGGLFSSAWKRKFITLLGETRSLDDIEHRLLRGAPEYRDPRIHFAVNCASIGCPALRPEAYTARELDTQLQDQTRRFLSDRSRNRFSLNAPMTLQLSSIFDWYGEDFAHGGGLAVFLADYAGALGASPAQAAALRNAEVEADFLPYDWRLNSTRRRDR